LQIAARRDRTLRLGKDSEVPARVQIGAEPDARQQICIGLLRLRLAELELADVLLALSNLPGEG
jgi:hypothetical protein